MGKVKHAQKILHFYCRPCREYHLKTHPHYRAMKQRSAKRRSETRAKGKPINE